MLQVHRRNVIVIEGIELLFETDTTKVSNKAEIWIVLIKKKTGRFLFFTSPSM